MRPIKFRAWDGKEKRMIYDIDLTTQDNDCHAVNGNWQDVISISDCEIMQFTGLCDKNGKEIYEGDIVQDRHGTKQTIKWDDSGDMMPGFIHETLNGNAAYLQVSTEVLGNIYENPDLLK